MFKCIKAYLFVYITVTRCVEIWDYDLFWRITTFRFENKMKNDFNPSQLQLVFFLWWVIHGSDLWLLLHISVWGKKMNFKIGVIKIYTQWRRVLTTEEFALAHQNDVTFAIRAKARLRQTRCHRLSYLWKDRVAVI